jgi:hypothetical protein
VIDSSLYKAPEAAGHPGISGRLAKRRHQHAANVASHAAIDKIGQFGKGLVICLLGLSNVCFTGGTFSNFVGSSKMAGVRNFVRRLWFSAA